MLFLTKATLSCKAKTSKTVHDGSRRRIYGFWRLVMFSHIAEFFLVKAIVLEIVDEIFDFVISKRW